MCIAQTRRNAEELAFQQSEQQLVREFERQRDQQQSTDLWVFRAVYLLAAVLYLLAYSKFDPAKGGVYSLYTWMLSNLRCDTPCGVEMILYGFQLVYFCVALCFAGMLASFCRAMRLSPYKAAWCQLVIPLSPHMSPHTPETYLLYLLCRVGLTL